VGFFVFPAPSRGLTLLASKLVFSEGTPPATATLFPPFHWCANIRPRGPPFWRDRVRGKTLAFHLTCLRFLCFARLLDYYFTEKTHPAALSVRRRLDPPLVDSVCSLSPDGGLFPQIFIVDFFACFFFPNKLHSPVRP